MLKILLNPTQIPEIQAEFVSKLKQLLPQEIPYTIGFQGENVEVVISTDKDLWFTEKLLLSTRDNVKIDRFWNAFGFWNSPKRSNIVTEINIPLNGVSKTIAGVFALDKFNNFCIAHRGRVGGGKIGVGKNAFTIWHRSRNPHRWIDLEEQDGSISEVVLVATLTSPDFLKDIKKFVDDVRVFKEQIDVLNEKIYQG